LDSAEDREKLAGEPGAHGDGGRRVGGVLVAVEVEAFAKAQRRARAISADLVEGDAPDRSVTALVNDGPDRCTT
jgi:hypothetical protein